MANRSLLDPAAVKTFVTAFAHPILLWLASVLFLYWPTGNMVSPDQLIRPLLVVSMLLILLAYPLSRLSGGPYWGGIALTIITLGLLSYWMFALVACGSAAVAVTIEIWRHRRRGIKLTIERVARILDISCIALVIILGAAASHPLTELPPGYFAALAAARHPTPTASLAQGFHPDIYYILLDGYGRSDVLDAYYDFENQAFISFLESQGFIVPAKSRSNYIMTAPSLASTLNMDYVQELIPGITESENWWLMAPLIDHSRARTILESAGYTTVSLATDWSITDNPSTDVYLAPRWIVLNDFENLLLGRTPLTVIRDLASNFSVVQTNAGHRRLLSFDFQGLTQIAPMPGPKFVFAHIMAPHPPFVVGAHGEPADPGYPFRLSDGGGYPLGAEAYKAGYIGQVQFVNSQLEQWIASLLRESEAPPIIILQADHGPRMLQGYGSENDTCLRERFSVFAAYYLPGLDRNRIPDEITNVNLFRIIFNSYFGTDLPLRENLLYAYNGLGAFDFEDVTPRADSCIQPQEAAK